MPRIELEKVTKTYKIGRRKLFRAPGEKRIEVGVEDVDLTIRQGEFVFVIGSSGAGKSTLLELISGQTKPNRGKVYIDNKDLAWMKRMNQNRASLLFGRVCQEPTLIRKWTVDENLMLAARICAAKGDSELYMRAKVRKVLGLVGLRGVERRYPAQLSIGESRRVELARALIGSPPILVLDEITANLDDDNIWDIMHLLNDINRRGTTVIMATHASQYVNIMYRRVVTLVDGHVFGDVRKGRYGDVIEEKRAPVFYLPNRFHIENNSHT